jgi:hypothetical protein
MEVRAFKLRGRDLHIIVDDVGHVWVSAATLASGLQYARPDKFADRYKDDSQHSKDRLEFPHDLLDAAHNGSGLFVRLVTVAEVMSLTAAKKALLSDLQLQLMEAGLALVAQERQQRDSLAPLERRSSRAPVHVAQRTSIGGGVLGSARHAASLHASVAARGVSGAAEEPEPDIGVAPVFEWVEHDVGAYESNASEWEVPRRESLRHVGKRSAVENVVAYAPPEYAVPEPPPSPFGGDAENACRDGLIALVVAVEQDARAQLAPGTPVGLRRDVRVADTPDALHLFGNEEPLIEEVDEHACMSVAAQAADELARHYRDVITAAGRGPVGPLRVHPPVVLRVRTTRTTSAIRSIAKANGHLFRPVGAAGSRHKELLLDVADVPEALLLSLDHFGMMHRIAARYESQGEYRCWLFTCTTLPSPEFRLLIEALMTDNEPVPVLPDDLNTPLCRAMAAEHPWLDGCFSAAEHGGPRGTTLGDKTQHAFADDVCLTSVAEIVAFLSHHPCPRCASVSGCELSKHVKHGVESVLELKCNRVECSHVFTYRPLAGAVGCVNKLAFVAAEMAGSREHVNRFLRGLLGMELRTGSNGSSWIARLAGIVNEVAEDMVMLQWQYASAATVMSAVTLDAFFQRAQRLGNHAHNVCETFVHLRTGNLLDYHFYNRIDVKGDRHMGMLATPSPFVSQGAPALTSEYKPNAIESVVMELAVQKVLQRIVRLFPDAQVLLADGGIDWSESMKLAARSLPVLVVDALQAGPTIIKKWFNDAGALPKVFNDWWHRRKAMSKCLRKLAGIGKGGGKAKVAKFPELEHAHEALNEPFNKALHAKHPFAAFAVVAKERALAHDIKIEELAKGPRAAWDKMMGNAQKTLESVNPDFHTSTNELIHNHRLHFIPKGVKCATVRFVMQTQMTFLSWNRVEGWMATVLMKFLASFYFVSGCVCASGGGSGGGKAVRPKWRRSSGCRPSRTGKSMCSTSS